MNDNNSATEICDQDGCRQRWAMSWWVALSYISARTADVTCCTLLWLALLCSLQSTVRLRFQVAACVLLMLSCTYYTGGAGPACGLWPDLRGCGTRDRQQVRCQLTVRACVQVCCVLSAFIGCCSIDVPPLALSPSSPSQLLCVPRSLLQCRPSPAPIEAISVYR